MATPIILAVEMIYFPDFTAVSSIILAIISSCIIYVEFEAKKPPLPIWYLLPSFSALGAVNCLCTSHM